MSFLCSVSEALAATVRGVVTSGRPAVEETFDHRSV